jgi:holo-[acyl-carrier protein] synthase
MAIVGLGLDLVQIERFERVHARHGEALLERLFTDGERAYCERRKASRLASYAGRFAVKEAVMKVLGTGWAKGVRWRDIEVVRRSGRAPELALHGVAAEIARSKGIARVLVTITHDAGIAAAVAVAEG